MIRRLIYMSSNRRAKERLIQLYGPECFIEKLQLRPDKERVYTGKSQMKRMRQLTYHHILEKSKGGKATIENRSFTIRRESRMVS